MNKKQEGHREGEDCAKVTGNIDTQISATCPSSTEAEKRPTDSQPAISANLVPSASIKNIDIDFDVSYERFLEWKELPDELEKNRSLLSDPKKIRELIFKRLEKSIQKEDSKIQEFLLSLKDRLGNVFFHGLALGVYIGMKIGTQMESPTKSKKPEPEKYTQQPDKNMELNNQYGTKKSEKKLGRGLISSVLDRIPNPLGKARNEKLTKPCSAQYLFTVLHAKDLESSPQAHIEIPQTSVEDIVSKARFMKVFCSVEEGQAVFENLKLSTEPIDYKQAINIALLIEVSGTKDLLAANSFLLFRSELNPDPQAMAIVKEIKRLASIEGVSNQLHRLV